MYEKELTSIIKEHVPEDKVEYVLSYMKNYWIYADAIRKHADERKKATDAYREYLKSHKIMGNISYWVQNKHEKFCKKYDRENPISRVYDEISNKMTGNEKYIFDISREILESDEYKMKEKQLTKEKTPLAGKKYKFIIWNPKNWKVVDRDGSGHFYDIKDTHTLSIKSLFPGWKLANIFLRSANYFWNGNFYLWYFASRQSFGLRSLVGVDNYHAGVKAARNGEEIILTPHNEKSTWFGRISRLWKNISESRKEFESKQDKGIIGKGITRIFNLAWNYGFKGLFGTLLCLFVHPLLSAICIGLSMSLMIISPVWALLGSLLLYLFDIFIYDTTTDEGRSHSIMPIFISVIFRVCVMGIFQFVASNVSMVFLFLGSIFMFLWSLLANGTRYLYDSLTYHMILKHFAKIPAANGFLEKRVAGPGLSTSYYYELDNELATIAIQYILEEFEVDIYTNNLKKTIDAPLQTLNRFYNSFQDVGLISVQTNNYNQNSNKNSNNKTARNKKVNDLSKTKKVLSDNLNKAIADHKKENILQGVDRVKNSGKHIKMSREELEITLQNGAVLCESFFNEKISPMLTADEVDQFWKSKRIETNNSNNDFRSLAAHCLKKVFGDYILTPIEDSDMTDKTYMRFSLDVDKQSLSTMVEDLFEGKPRELLDTSPKYDRPIQNAREPQNRYFIKYQEFPYFSNPPQELSISKNKFKEYYLK